MPGRPVADVLAAEPPLQVLPWAELAARASSAAWADALTVDDVPTTPVGPGTGAGGPTLAAGAPAPAPTTRTYSLRVTVPERGRFVFDDADFAVALGAVGGPGVVHLVVRLDVPPRRPSVRPGRPLRREWSVEVRGDVALVLRHDALVPVPAARPRRTVRAPTRPIAMPPRTDLRTLLGGLRSLGPAELEVPLGTSTLLLRPGPRMTAVPPLDVRGRKLALGTRGVVVALERLAPAYADDALTVTFLGGRLALAGTDR